MNNGFSLVELLVAIAVSFTMFMLVASNITEGITMNRKVTSRHQQLESLFFTVDTIKNDLTKCGMRLQEAASLFDLRLFSHTQSGFKVVYGLSADELPENCTRGDKEIEVTGTDFIQKGRKLLIYDPVSLIHEFVRVKKKAGNRILL